MTNVYPIKCRIRNDGGDVTRVDVYDDIGAGGWFSEGVSAADFASQLAGVKGSLEIHINSCGGDCFDGMAIKNAIEGHNGQVTTVVDGVAASIASVVAQAGSPRVVAPGALMMIHDAFCRDEGNAAEKRKTADTLDKVSDNIAGVYAQRSGRGRDQWRQAMRDETWYTAEEAVQAGLADRVGTVSAKLPATVDVAALAGIPARIAAQLRSMPRADIPQAAAGQPPQPDRPTAASQAHGPNGTTPFTGSHNHGHSAYGHSSGDDDGSHSHAHEHDGDANHGHGHSDGGPADHHEHLTSADVLALIRHELQAAAGQPGTHGDHEKYDPDGDGDCDACPEGDTDHDYWTAGGKQLQSVPGKPMPAEDTQTTALRSMLREELTAAGLIPGPDGYYQRPVNADGVDNSPWDASKAWHNGAESDDPAAFYAGICAGKKAGDKSTQDAWALPYKYTPSSPPNAAGVRNALARLPQTQGLTNEAEAKATLEAAMKKVNPDYEPEDAATGIDISGIDLEGLRSALKEAVR